MKQLFIEVLMASSGKNIVFDSCIYNVPLPIKPQGDKEKTKWDHLYTSD